MERQEKTTHLFHKDNHKIYLKFLQEIERRGRVQARNILSSMDFDNKKLLNRLISRSDFCRKEYDLINNFLINIKKHIPYNNFSHDIRKSYEYSISEVFKRVRRKNIISFLKKFYIWIERVRVILKDLYNVIFSIRMAVVYVGSILLGLLLNWILN